MRPTLAELGAQLLLVCRKNLPVMQCVRLLSDADKRRRFSFIDIRTDFSHLTQAAAKVIASERPLYREPLMDRELPLVLFAAVVAAVVLFGIQVQSSAASQRQEAASHKTYRTAQRAPDSRLASSQVNFSDTFGQRIP